MSVSAGSFDVAIVGAGVLGLAHAYVAASRGKRVAVIERDTRANGASIRNFGFVTVTGQQRGESWTLARRTRDVWAKIAPRAGIAVHHAGLLLTVRRPEAVAVAEAFLKSEMGEGCGFLDAKALRDRHPQVAAPDALGALTSPHELRVESRDAIPQLTAWLAEAHGVDFIQGAAALKMTDAGVETSRGFIGAEMVVVCPGDDFASLYPERIEAYRPTRCRLSMLKLASPGFQWPAAIMSDLSLARYAGYADLPEAAPLKARLAAEQAEHLAHGVHLIVVQSGDGGLVVGDSHHYEATPQPFAEAATERLILDEFAAAIGSPPPPVVERWTGSYAVASDRTYFIDAPEPHVRLVMVTSGTGASTCFGIAERTFDSLLGAQIAA
jgi:D-hydroxyproline dehydrogenase subunit beta